MAKFEFGFEETWFRLIIKNIPNHPELFLPKNVEEAQTILRVGKLKVGAARAWAESAEIIYKKKGQFLLTPLGKIIAQHDPELEENGIWWVIHYNLARINSPAWFYSFYFNEFNVDSFSREEFERAVREFWDKSHDKPMADSVFHKLIFSPFKQVFEGTRLGNEFGFWMTDQENNYLCKPQGAPPLSRTILAYALLDWSVQQQRLSVHFEKLLEPGGIGKIFKVDREVLDTLLIDIGERYEKQVAWISHTAGLNSVSVMDCPPLALISTYYYELDGENPMTALELGKKEVARFMDS